MKLICFGDSWTAGHGVESDPKYKESAFPDMFTQKLREQNSWPRWLANELNSIYVNMAVCGYGNDYISRDIEVSLNEKYIDKDDIVIVMLSYPYRYKKYDDLSVVDLFWKIENLLSNYKHFYFNSFYPTFREEDFDVNLLPKCFIDPTSTISEILKEYEIKNNVGVWEYGSRSVWNDEKNYWEGDYHPNALGYRIMGKHIYEKIKDKL